MQHSIMTTYRCGLCPMNTTLMHGAISWYAMVMKYIRVCLSVHGHRQDMWWVCRIQLLSQPNIEITNDACITSY